MVITLVSLGLSLLGSVSYNAYQFSEKAVLSNKDIKFRYFKGFGNITPEDLLKLETIFEYKPDK
ncbi:MAG: hypothetical protein LIP00_04630 [Parabacteroides sp.]|nr:hypothetical protein [Parabacteroides sp.]